MWMDDDLWSLVAEWCSHPSDVFTIASSAKERRRRPDGTGRRS